MCGTPAAIEQLSISDRTGIRRTNDSVIDTLFRQQSPELCCWPALEVNNLAVYQTADLLQRATVGVVRPVSLTLSTIRDSPRQRLRTSTMTCTPALARHSGKSACCATANATPLACSRLAPGSALARLDLQAE